MSAEGSAPEGFAVISDCGTYRYRLGRMWGRVIDPTVMFVMLNPSTADATENDATIRRCVAFARDWGFGHLLVGNKFAFRATDPRVLKLAIARGDDAIGPENDQHLTHMAEIASTIICAWGLPGGKEIPDALIPFRDKLHHLGFTKGGMPRHPLYLPSELKPTHWSKP